MHGIPMVATSPVRHDSPVGGPGGPGGPGGVDIQSYEPPWKALTDFALHTDLDRGLNPNAANPHFQHLVNQVSLLLFMPAKIFVQTVILDYCTAVKKSFLQNLL